MKRPPVVNLFDLSTAHLSIDSRALLDHYAANGTHGIMARDEGYFISSGLSQWSEADSKFPADLLHVAAFAAANDFSYVLFDQDADILDGLPVYQDIRSPESTANLIGMQNATLEWRSVRDGKTIFGKVLAMIPGDGYADSLKIEPEGLTLHDADHEISGDGAWITAKEAAIRIFTNDEAVVVTVYAKGCEMDTAFSSVAILREDLQEMIRENLDEGPAP